MADQNQQEINQEEKDKQLLQTPSEGREYQGEPPMPDSSDDRSRNQRHIEKGEPNDDSKKDDEFEDDEEAETETNMPTE